MHFLPLLGDVPKDGQLYLFPFSVVGKLSKKSGKLIISHSLFESDTTPKERKLTEN